MCIWISFHWLWTQQHDWVKRTALCVLRSDWLTKMKESSSFPLHENNPVHPTSKQLWAEWSCEKLAMSSSKRPRLCTEYYRKTKGSSSDTQSSSASKESTFFGTWSNWNGHVCFLRKRFVTADLKGLQAPVLLFCFNRERQSAKEM